MRSPRYSCWPFVPSVPPSLLRLLQRLCFLPEKKQAEKLQYSKPCKPLSPGLPTPWLLVSNTPLWASVCPSLKGAAAAPTLQGVRTQWFIQVEASVSRKRSMIGQDYSHTEEGTLEAQPTE